ncbi:hypothetical protein VPH35_001102 [Triticum aestivum]
METVEQQAVAINTKLDSIVEQLKGMTAWMQTMDSTAKLLTASAFLLQLHADDATARLEALESPPARSSGPANTSAPTPTVEVRTYSVDRPNGHDGHHQQPRLVLGDHRSSDLPPANGMPLLCTSTV